MHGLLEISLSDISVFLLDSRECQGCGHVKEHVRNAGVGGGPVPDLRRITGEDTSSRVREGHI